MKRQEAVGE